jgi:hypothetical protein
VAETITTGVSHEREVSDGDGRKYSMRICPYLTTDGQVDGTVICILDIDGWNRPRRAAN